MPEPSDARDRGASRRGLATLACGEGLEGWCEQPGCSRVHLLGQEAEGQGPEGLHGTLPSMFGEWEAQRSCHTHCRRWVVGRGPRTEWLTPSAAPPAPPSPASLWDLLLHGQELGVHAFLLPLHQLHVGQQLRDTVLVNLYVLALQGGHLGPHREGHCSGPNGRGEAWDMGERAHELWPGGGPSLQRLTGPWTRVQDGQVGWGTSGHPVDRASPHRPEGGQGGCLLTLVTFLLMFSRSCSWPRRKHGCWNSVSSLSGLTRPPCSMWTTFRKPSAQGGVRAALPQVRGHSALTAQPSPTGG